MNYPGMSSSQSVETLNTMASRRTYKTAHVEQIISLCPWMTVYFAKYPDGSFKAEFSSLHDSSRLTESGRKLLVSLGVVKVAFAAVGENEFNFSLGFEHPMFAAVLGIDTVKVKIIFQSAVGIGTMDFSMNVAGGFPVPQRRRVERWDESILYQMTDVGFYIGMLIDVKQKLAGVNAGLLLEIGSPIFDEVILYSKDNKMVPCSQLLLRETSYYLTKYIVKGEGGNPDGIWTTLTGDEIEAFLLCIQGDYAGAVYSSSVQTMMELFRFGVGYDIPPLRLTMMDALLRAHQDMFTADQLVEIIRLPRCFDLIKLRGKAVSLLGRARLRGVGNDPQLCDLLVRDPDFAMEVFLGSLKFAERCLDESRNYPYYANPMDIYPGPNQAR